MLKRHPAPESAPMSTPTPRRPSPAPSSTRRTVRRSRRAALSLAAAVTAPAVAAGFFAGRTLAAEPGGSPPAVPNLQSLLAANDLPNDSGDAMPAAGSMNGGSNGGSMSDAQKLALGQQQYRQGSFEEATRTLRGVSANRLSADQRGQLDKAMGDAAAAAGQRRQARAEFDAGQQAWMGQKWVDAISHYRAAYMNDYADPATQAKAREQVQLAGAKLNQEGTSFGDVYNEGVKNVNDGNLKAARPQFAALDAVGYNAPLFKKSPRNYLREIDQQMPADRPAMAAATPVAPVPPAMVSAPQTPAAAPSGNADMTGAMAAAAPASGDNVSADSSGNSSNPSPNPSPDATGRVIFGAPAPSTTARPSGNANNSGNTGATMQPPAPPARAAAPAPSDAAAAKEAYVLGKQQYESGDLPAAKASFATAQRLGYRAGLFETSPSKYQEMIADKQQATAVRDVRTAAANNNAANTAAQADQTTPPVRFDAPPANTARPSNPQPSNPPMNPPMRSATMAPAMTAPAMAPPMSGASRLDVEAKSEQIRQQQAAYKGRELMRQGDAAPPRRQCRPGAGPLHRGRQDRPLQRRRRRRQEQPARPDRPAPRRRGVGRPRLQGRDRAAARRDPLRLRDRRRQRPDRPGPGELRRRPRRSPPRPDGPAGETPRSSPRRRSRHLTRASTRCRRRSTRKSKPTSSSSRRTRPPARPPTPPTPPPRPSASAPT